MAGFRSLAEQVRDPRLTPEQRRTALRRCLEKFAPYGHRATWHHLCGRVGIGTEDRRPRPDRLVAALAELEEARRVWLAYDVAFGVRRKQEKRLGIRQPSALDDWHRCTWGGCGVAWCDDPLVHPTAPLADVLRRIITALESEPGSLCPVCDSPRIAWRGGLDHVPSSGPVCTDCGIVVPEPVLTEQALAASRRSRRPALASATTP
ncbi:MULTISPECIES: hypothetical protein [Streptomyces]|uniref:Uncharacterized protein n=2 Tax=Streptomyces TaxID=1883 RepID=A0A3M8F9G4_9ACTN|nr:MULTISPECIES: hypothetical protein [Streptomyces]KNE80396.1 hypothetical protein ADZ36_22145 [Streptomyces fradiae]OFA53102.1 hypothetical protein BEN35_09870 [Streptomyces fradiae]PQM19983.1 hypothetical protein Sfr7A_28975 [Streptomyces xinghaiensis]RKM96417.1 hypothetical protein SFRA_010080 [Streptomyces xinghaiensis]RNC74432.1 hypothetical protein DC095_012065 [Streptomyces xinghaiensis]